MTRKLAHTILIKCGHHVYFLGELQKNISELRQLVEDHYQCVCNSCSTPIHVVSPGDITDISTPNMSTG